MPGWPKDAKSRGERAWSLRPWPRADLHLSGLRDPTPWSVAHRRSRLQTHPIISPACAVSRFSSSLCLTSIHGYPTRLINQSIASSNLNLIRFFPSRHVLSDFFDFFFFISAPMAPSPISPLIPGSCHGFRNYRSFPDLDGSAPPPGRNRSETV
jgi:hypothetical protein